MLAIRLQRRGRKKLAHYKVVVQESRYSPTSGKVVKYLGSYDPHAKTLILDKDNAQKFLDNGAQPSDRVARLFKNERCVNAITNKFRSLKVTSKTFSANPLKSGCDIYTPCVSMNWGERIKFAINTNVTQPSQYTRLLTREL